MKDNNKVNRERNFDELHDPSFKMEWAGGYTEKPESKIDARKHREKIMSLKLKNKAKLENPNFHTGGLK